MFSGLTSQVTTWMGMKGEDGSEIGPDGPVELDPNAPVAATADGQPGSASSKLEMLAGVKSQVASSMSGWLSGGIPGLNRGGAGDGSTEVGPQDGTTVEPTPAPRDPASVTEHVKDDDASSATGGADSGPGSPGGTPTEEQQQAFGAGMVSTKAIAGAKSFGGFLYSAVNKAGKSVAEATVKIKKTVEENRLIADLNKEQEAFIASKPGEKGEAVAPWIGAPNEEALREECLALSTDRRNFVRAPPPGVDFAWDFDAIQPVAQATLALDPNLESMRFELVPKVISEENFWRNYFYRVSLLRQSHELNAMANQSTDSNPNYTSSDSVDHQQGIQSDVQCTSKEATSTTESEVQDASKGVKKLNLTSKK
ncbi:hypothetical protein QAD02_014796, partial [Eretmocerus hayati]